MLIQKGRITIHFDFVNCTYSVMDCQNNIIPVNEHKNQIKFKHFTFYLQSKQAMQSKGHRKKKNTSHIKMQNIVDNTHSLLGSSQVMVAVTKQIMTSVGIVKMMFIHVQSMCRSTNTEINHHMC